MQKEWVMAEQQKLGCKLLQNIPSYDHPLCSRADSSTADVWSCSTKSSSRASSEADIKDTQDCVDVRDDPWTTHREVSSDTTESKHRLGQIISKADFGGCQETRDMQTILDMSSVHYVEQTPSFSAHDGASTVALPLRSAVCLMSEFEVMQRLPPLHSQQPPLPRGAWMQDTKQCAICTQDFGIWTLKHHCRSCGRNVCNACSPFRENLKSPLAHPSKGDVGPHRVCVGCHEPF